MVVDTSTGNGRRGGGAASSDAAAGVPRQGAAAVPATPPEGGAPEVGADRLQRLYAPFFARWEMILIVVLCQVDVILLKHLADVLVNDNSAGGLLSWMLAAGTSLTGLVVAARAGALRAGEKKHVLMLRLWAGIGICLTVLRALAGPISGNDLEFSDVALALLLLCLYLAAGWGMYTLAQEVFDPARLGQLSATAARRKAARHAGSVEGPYSAHFLAAQRCDDGKVQVERDLKHVEALIEAYRDRLYAHARVEFSRTLVDPVATTDATKTPVRSRLPYADTGA